MKFLRSVLGLHHGFWQPFTFLHKAQKHIFLRHGVNESDFWTPGYMQSHMALFVKNHCPAIFGVKNLMSYLSQMVRERAVSINYFNHIVYAESSGTLSRKQCPSIFAGRLPFSPNGQTYLTEQDSCFAKIINAPWDALFFTQ